MTRGIRTVALWTVLTLGGVCLLEAREALAQGPYGRNSYEDFPFNQGSLFYRPLKPRPRPRPRVAKPSVARPGTALPPAGYPYTYPQPYTYIRPYTFAPQGGYYYSYPANPGAPR